MRWTVADFKGLTKGSLDLGENVKTFLVGVNSSGKSSLTQSALFVAQSQYQPGPLVANGPLVRLGTPVDAIRDGMSHVKLELETTGARDHTRAFSRRIRAAYNIGPDAAEQNLTIDRLTIASVRESEGSEIVLNFSNEHSRTADLSLAHEAGTAARYLHLKSEPGRRRRLRTFIGLNGICPVEIIVLYNEEQYVRLFKRRALRELESISSGMRAGYFASYAMDEQLWAAMSDQEARVSETNRARISELFAEYEDRGFELGQRWPSLAEADREIVLKVAAMSAARTPYVVIPLRDETIRSHWSLTDPVVSEVMEQLKDEVVTLNALRSGIEKMAASVQYLGPLRDEPRVVWTQWDELTRGLPVGRRGEFTATVLSRHSTRNVTFVSPDNAQMDAPLGEAINMWLTYLDLGQRATTDDRGKLGTGLQISRDGRARDLTAVGVGVSQALPIVTSVLAVRRGSQLFLEQPELHLHPAVQARLGDFLALARPDISIVVETHSEALITRLRRRAAEGVVDPETVRLIFVEPEEGGARSRRIDITRTGELSEWPEGFLSSSADDIKAIFRANMPNGRR